MSTFTVCSYYHKYYVLQCIYICICVCVGHKFIQSNFMSLWFQQYRAMFIKRWHNFKRFLPAFFWQLVLPMLFLILGLVLAVVLPTRYDNDPRRNMSLPLSAPSQTRKLFWADFSETDDLPFSMEVRNSSKGL